MRVESEEAKKEKSRRVRTVKQQNRTANSREGFSDYGKSLFRAQRKERPIDRKERNARPVPKAGRYHHDTQERADHCCGVVFQPQRHRELQNES